MRTMNCRTAPVCTWESFLALPYAVNMDKAGVEQGVPAVFPGL